jgi:hypothetical protein
MKLVLSLVLLMFCASVDASADDTKTDPLSAVAWIVGDWSGLGEGEPGVSASARHVQRTHGSQFIVVEGRSVYPKQEKNKLGEVHTSTDIWSFDKARGLLVMRQFDSLGFASTYVQDTTASTEGQIVLSSEQLENVPKGWSARYTYTYIAPDEYRELFELNTGKKGFQTYVAGKFLRDK